MPAELREDNDNYIFQRDTNASSRLNLQYWLWQYSLGFILAPGIPEPCPGYRVADVATGTGVWLYELSRQVPADVELVGLDISLAQVPPTSQRSDNMVFREWNFYDEPPEDLKESFDLVHMRLIAVVIKDNDPTKVLKNVERLLKPGGYLQWEEHFTADCKVDLSRSTLELRDLRGLQRICDTLSKQQIGSFGQTLLGPRTWIDSLDSTLSKQGFEGVDGNFKICYPDPPFLGKFWTDIYIQTIEEFANQTMDNDQDFANDLKECLAAAQKEKLTGAWVSDPKAVFLGRLKHSASQTSGNSN